MKGVEQLLEKLNQNMETVLREVTSQGKAISEISVKVDVYTKQQDQFTRDLKDIDRMATEALSSTKSSHKRIDVIEEDGKWMKRALIVAILGFVGNFAAHFIK